MSMLRRGPPNLIFKLQLAINQLTSQPLRIGDEQAPKVRGGVNEPGKYGIELTQHRIDFLQLVVGD